MTEETAQRVDRLGEAIRIVAVQTGSGFGDALSLMADRAQVSHCTLDDLASAVVDGTVRFDE